MIFEMRGGWSSIQGIRFINVRSADDSSCAILVRGRNTNISDCVFRDNSCSIRVATNNRSDVYIIGCELDNSGSPWYPSGAVDVDTERSLSVIGNYMHGSVIGREVHSRALRSYLAYNRIESDLTVAGALVTFSNKGMVCLVGNNLSKHGLFERIVIEYSADTAKHTGFGDELILAFNTIVCDQQVRYVVGVFGRPGASTRFVNNILVGVRQCIDRADSADTTQNIHVADITSAGLSNTTVGDVRLLPTSSARGGAVSAGTYTGGVGDSTWQVAIEPIRQYVHPASSEPRTSYADMGALAYAPTTSLPDVFDDHASIRIAPNTAHTSLILSLPASLIGHDVVIMNLQGSEVARWRGSQPHILRSTSTLHRSLWACISYGVERERRCSIVHKMALNAAGNNH